MKNIKELIPDYVLGLLERDQETQVEAFLDNCETCQAELQKYNTMFVGMVESLPKVSPSLDSWDKLKQQIYESAVNSAVNSQQSLDVQKQLQIPATNKNNLPVRSRLRNILSLPNFAYQGSLAVMGILALGAFWWGGYQYKAHVDMVHEKQMVSSWLANAEVQTIPIQSVDNKQIGSLFLRPDHQALFVLAEPPPPGQAYQTWGEMNDTCFPLMLSKNSIFEVSWQDNYKSLLVSLEPQEGSKQLTHRLAQVFMF